MVFYKIKRIDFAIILIMTITAWISMFLCYICNSYIGLDTIIIPTVLFIISIDVYKSCYIKNIKYVVNDLGIESYDSKNNLLSKNTWSENYEIERVISRKNHNKRRKVFCKISFDNNSYIFRWDNRIIKNLKNYCNVDEILEGQSERNRKRLILTIILLSMVFIKLKFQS